MLAAVSTSGIIFALLGFEQADQLAGESANPKRDIPRAVIGAIAIGAVIYVLLQVVFLLAMPPSQIGSTWAGSPFATFSGPFANLATLVGLGWLATNPLHRRGDLAGRDRADLHHRLVARVLRPEPQRLRARRLRADRPARRPVVGLITAFVVGCVCFLPFPSWRSLVGLITSASVLMYAGAARRSASCAPACPTPSGPTGCPAAIAARPAGVRRREPPDPVVGWTTDWKLGGDPDRLRDPGREPGVLKLNPTRPQFEVRSAVWLPVYLVGMGLIVYLSDFGPTADRWFPLWWDMVAVAVFSVAIYAWAQRSGLPVDRVQALVNRGPVTEEPPGPARGGLSPLTASSPA